MNIAAATCMELRYPVHLRDGRLLLPAGALLTPDCLEEVAAMGRKARHPSARLLGFGTIREDLARFVRMGAYDVIFREEKRFRSLLGLMEKVAMPLPLLEALGYFKARDPDTYRHILSVFALSTQLGQEIVEDHRERVLGAYAGPLHDFGKTAIPLSILKKRTPLTRRERDILEHHTSAGFVLLCHYLGDRKAVSARVALEHHERRDGSGYPRGIPMSDRMVEIVAVCDIYDALISPRPYRPECYGNRTALEELTAMAHEGRVDPVIVRALVACNRKDRPRDYREVVLSSEKRGTAPQGNVYGIIQEEGPGG